MKRKILKTFSKINKKFVLCMMLAGFAATNSGFTDNSESPKFEAKAPAQIEQTDAKEPTTIAVGENGRLKVSDADEMSRALLEVVENSLTQEPNEPVDTSLQDKSLDEVEENPQALEISNVEEIEPVEPVEEFVPENVVETANGYLPYSETFTMEATAYLPTDGSAEGITAMGIPATYGIVAVDPYVIPLGSRVYIPGYGEALAADTGGAIYGYKIDLCMEDYWQAMDFGRRMVTVFVLK